jgi:pilus assembly protein CpaC
MHPKRFTHRSHFWGAILVVGLAAAVTRGQQPPPNPVPLGPGQQPDVVKVDPRTGQLLVPVNGTVSWSPVLPEPPTEGVIISPDTVVQMRDDPSKAQKYLLVGRAPGLATITFNFKGQPRRVFEVLVQPDLNLLRAIIKRTVPTAAVEVQPGLQLSSIILSGYVATVQDADIVQRLAVTAAGGRENNVINAVQVGGGQQVQIDVVVASVDRTMARSRGLDFSTGGATVNFQSLVSGLITSPLGAQTTSTTGSGPTISPNSNLQIGILPSGFYIAMQALRTEGIAKFLAEPKVVTQTGRSAYFRAGGQQAILSNTSGITGPGVQLVPFGTELEVLPIVYGNGMIWMEINPRITAVSAGLGITVGGAVSPGFTEQQLRSAVMLESGQTFAIGGLVQNTIQAGSSKIPVLGDLPFMGVLFSTVTHSQTESELLIMVTPRLVSPMNCDQVPKRVPGRETRNPDDYELFLENILEAPRGQRKVFSNRCYNAAYKCDPTAAIFPCVGGVCPTGNCGGRVGPVVPGMAPPSSAAPVVPIQPSGPAALPPIPQPMPAGGAMAVPPVPGLAPVGEIGSIEPPTAVVPAGLPPVIIIPEVPRN